MRSSVLRYNQTKLVIHFNIQIKRALDDFCSAFYLTQNGFTEKEIQVGGIAYAIGASKQTQMNLYSEYQEHRSIVGKLMYLAATLPRYDCDASGC